VRTLAGALLLPALVAAFDAFARASRRRQPMAVWAAWAITSAFPFLVAGGVALLLAVTGLLPAAPAAPAPDGAAAFGGGGWAALGIVALTIAAGVPLRRLVLRSSGLAPVGGPGGDALGAAAATALFAVLVAVGVWVANPFAAALMVPAAHAALFVTAPEVRMRRPVALLLVALVASPLALIALYYARQFGLNPEQSLQTGLLVVAGGHFGVRGLLGWSFVLGALSCLVVVAASQRR
jgi:hypothetical protein